MAGQSQSHHCDALQDVPRVLVIKPPGLLLLLGDQFLASPKFQLLKAYESPLPLPELLAAHAQSVPAVIAPTRSPITADVIRLMPALRLIVTTSAGFDHVDLVECRSRGIAVATAGTIYAEDVADSAVGLLIDVLRRVSAGNRFVKRGLWSTKGDYHLGSKLGGKHVGIVGLGSIGLAVAKRLEAFGCQISYTSRAPKSSVSYAFHPDMFELAAKSDVLVICCALTEETHHLINKEVLRALGKRGVIINVARGGIIDQKELVRCLVEGEIAGAGMDVFEKEPRVPEELFELDNVVMSPHSAVRTREGCEELSKLVVGNLEAFFSNRPLLTPLGHPFL